MAKKPENARTIYVPKSEWVEWGDVAHEARMSKSGFVRQAVEQAIRRFRISGTVLPVVSAPLAVTGPTVRLTVKPKESVGHDSPQEPTLQGEVGFCRRSGCLNYQKPEHAPYCSERCKPT